MLEALLLGSRLIVGAVFLVAGLAKLVDRAGAARAMRDFGVPAPLAGPLGRLLPLAELALAPALLSATTAWWGAWVRSGSCCSFARPSA